MKYKMNPKINPMYSRVISISIIKNSVGLLSAQVDGIENNSNWIAIKWFHPEDYFQTQEQLNDASEIFAEEILKDLSLYHFIKIEDCKRREGENGLLNGFSFEVAQIYHKTKI